jgi:hypothetical protein
VEKHFFAPYMQLFFKEWYTKPKLSSQPDTGNEARAEAEHARVVLDIPASASNITSLSTGGGAIPASE